MQLSRHPADHGPRWFANSSAIEEGVNLGAMLGMTKPELLDLVARAAEYGHNQPGLLKPIDSGIEIWAAGVTYLRSRDERQAESTVADVYGRVYDADRPELFFKATAARAVGSGGKIRVRKDSAWNVPEPELTLVINSAGEIVGYTAGNDVSSRSIEGENPLYLPQAKCYDGSCAIGPTIVLAEPHEMVDLHITCEVRRNGVAIFREEASTAQMKRTLTDLVAYLFRESSFPRGVFLMTGTPIVPSPDFTLQPGDRVFVQVGELNLFNEVDDHR